MVAAILGSAASLRATHPDATLQLTAGEADLFIETLIAQDEDPDISTLRRFERYHDLDVWSARRPKPLGVVLRRCGLRVASAR